MIHHLRAAGTSFVLDARGTGVPVIVHWGSDLGALARDALESLVDSQMPAVGPSSIDTPLRQSILPVMADGWNGRPGIAGHFEGSTSHAPAFTLSVTELIQSRLLITLDATGLTVVVVIDLSADGVLRQRLTVTNTGDSVYALASLDATLPIPTRARELLDFTGRWPRERQPQRRDIANGTWTRDSRHGRPGHDNAFLMVAGTPGFGFRSGEVWGAHLAWSGDQRLWAESASTGHTLLGGGELFEPGEVRLAAGESFESPWLVATYSDAGLDGLAQSFHRFIRSRRRLSTRKVMLNTWEAVYFDQSAERLIELADAAASVGVERFVLDDGWMIGRTDDRRALGDWIVDPVKWPDGLHPLVDHVLSLGMDFGLWVEPEMVSLDSAVAREHPEWVLGADSADSGADARLPLPWRWQQVLDLANPDAFAHVHAQLAALLREYPISYLKWDQNRDLLGGSAHRHTTATYALMDALRAEFPGLEIESCSSGGGRVDLGVIEHTDRVWPSDTNDSLERQAIYRWTAGLVPPEFLGAHLGAPTAHTTGRTHELSFRLATALFGHSGIEWDVTTLDDADRAAVAEWVAAYKLHRGLLHSGDVVRSDAGDATRWVHGVVASDASSALFAVVAMTATRDAIVGPTTLPGLDPSRDYRVTPVRLGAWPRVVQDAPPPWWDAGGVTMSGRMLAAVGIPMPLLAPEQALVLYVEQV